MDSDGACSDKSNEVAAASPQVEGDKIRDFLTTKKIQSWIGLAELQKKVRPMDCPKIVECGADWL